MALRIAVLISGRGSNLRAIARAIDAGTCDAHIAVVVSDRATAEGLTFARERGLPTAVVPMRDYADRAAWDAALASTLTENTPDLIVLAGFMRLVGAALLSRFAHRIINVHPALLPLFPGTTGPEQAIAAGVRVSGCTVHVVDAGVDTGPILAQAVVRVLPSDTAETLHARIQRAEHRLLPSIIDAIARGRITLGSPVTVHGAHGEDDIVFSPCWDRS